MAEEAKTYVFGNDGANNMWPLAFANNNGFGGNGWGGAGLGFIGGLLLGGLWNGGFGGWGNNGGNNAAVAAGMYANDSATRDLIMQGINGNKEAISALATTLNMNVNQVQNEIS